MGQTITNHYLNRHSNFGSSTNNGSMTKGVGTSQEWSKHGHGHSVRVRAVRAVESCWKCLHVTHVPWHTHKGQAKLVWFALSWCWFVIFHDMLYCWFVLIPRLPSSITWDLSLGTVTGNVDEGDHMIFTYFTTKHVHSNTAPKVRVY